MTQKANPSVNRPAGAFKTSGAIAYGGHGGTGFVKEGSNPTDISVQDSAIDETALNSFEQSSSTSSLTVTIDPGEAFVFGSWICKDTESNVTLESGTAGQTVFVGWNKSGPNDVIVGLESAFSNAEGDTDEKISLFSFDTDSSGVTSVVDERSFDQISADSVEDAFVENTGDTMLGDLSFEDNLRVLFGSDSDFSLQYVSTDNELKIIDETNGVIKMVFDKNGDVFIPNGDLDLGGTNTVTNLSEPSNSTDVATKAFTESVAQGLTLKDSVRVSNHNENIDLTSSTDPNPIDGITLNDGDRILLKHQNTLSENGIYDAVTATDPTTWVRSDDFDEDAEVTQGAFTFVRDGTHANESYVVITSDPISVGTDDIEFAQFAAAGELSGGTNVSISGDVIDVSPQGTGSGLDADTVDGIEASNLGSSVSDSGTSVTDPATTINFTGNINASNSATTGQADISLNNNSVTITSGDGLNGGGNISLGNSTSISINSSDIAGSGLTTDGSNNITLSNDSVSVNSGDGLNGGGNVSLGNSTTISVDVSDFTGSGLTADGNNNIDLSNDSISVSTGTDLTGGGTVSLGGSITVNHADTSNEGDGFAGNNDVIDDINLDSNGHVTFIGTERRDLNDWDVPGDFNINNASKIGLPHRSSDPGANPGDMWYRTDLD